MKIKKFYNIIAGILTLILALFSAQYFANHRSITVGCNEYVFDKSYAPVWNGSEIVLYAELLATAEGGLYISAPTMRRAGDDPSIRGVEIMIFPREAETDKSSELDTSSWASLPFDSRDGLAAAPAPMASGFYLGDPKRRAAPAGGPILFGCTEYLPEATGNSFNECQVAYRLMNGDMLSYNFAGVLGNRPKDWVSIDAVVRGLIEHALSDRSRQEIRTETCQEPASARSFLRVLARDAADLGVPDRTCARREVPQEGSRPF